MDPIDLLGVQGGEASLQELVPDAAPAVRREHPQMVKVTPSAIVPANGDADEFAAIDCDVADPGIANRHAAEAVGGFNFARPDRTRGLPKPQCGRYVIRVQRADRRHRSITLANATERQCVIYNPAAGRGRAKKKIDDTRRWAGPDAMLMPTEGPGHAIELGRSAADAGFDKVIAAGGDGTVHEVANGLLQSDCAAVTFGVWPLGSSNDYAFALGLHEWLARRGDGFRLERFRADVGRVRIPGHERFFVNGAGFGFNGMVAHEARGIRRLRGTALYSLAFVRSMIWHYRTPIRKTLFDEIAVEGPTLSVSVGLGICEGGFPIAPKASLDDGLFDTLHVSDMNRRQMIRYLPSFMRGRVPTHLPCLTERLCRTVRSEGDETICIHADGEIVCDRSAGVRDVEMELLPGRLSVHRAMGC